MFTLLVVGALLVLSGRDGNSKSNSGAAASPTARSSPTQAAAAAPSVTLTPTGAVPTATATTPAPTEAAPTETPTEADATATEPDATATATEAADTPTADAQPTQAPADGEFGQLPPAEIPSGGLARGLNLTYQLDVSPDSAPTEADVYQLVWPERTKADVTALARSLGITGDVVEQGGGAFSVDGPGGSLSIAPDVAQIALDAPAQSGALEDDATLVDNARTWLLDHNLVSETIGDGAVTGKDAQAGRATVVFAASEPSPLLAAYPSARVTVEPGGVVSEAYVKWPASYATATYPLQSADDLWAAVQSGQGYTEADLSGVPGSGPLSGTLTISAISLAYSTATSSSGDYLVPVMVFSGEARLDESGMSVPVSVYVPAIAGQPAPRG